MVLKFDRPYMLVLDLDDTIYKEVEFLKSAYRYIANDLEHEIGENIYKEMLALWHKGISVFDFIKEKYDFQKSIKELVFDYRFHTPQLELPTPSKRLLERSKNQNIILGLLTDGRSKSQRNKLRSLGIENRFEKIIISEEFGSEKPNRQNYLAFMSERPNMDFVYVGDNVKKDFVSPNKLDWITIGLKDNGENIHTQEVDVSVDFLPKYWVNSIDEIELSL